jgi:hypothetical protein
MLVVVIFPPIAKWHPHLEREVANIAAPLKRTGRNTPLPPMVVRFESSILDKYQERLAESSTRQRLGARGAK